MFLPRTSTVPSTAATKVTSPAPGGKETVVRSTTECIAKPTSRSGDEREVAEIRLAVAT